MSGLGDPLERERRLGQALVARGLVRAEQLGPLLQEGRTRGLSLGGSALLGAAVAARLLGRDDAERLLAGLSSDGGATVADPGSSLGGAAPGPNLAPGFGQSPGGAPAWSGPPPGGAPTLGPPGVAGAGYGHSPGAAGASGAGPAPTLAGPGAAFAAGPGAGPPGPGATFAAGPGATFAAGPSTRPPSAPDLTYLSYGDAPSSAAAGAPGSPTPLALSLSAAERRYGALEPIGGGRYATLDQTLRRPVVLQRLEQAEESALFYRHARILAQLDHPAVAKVHDVGALGGTPFFTADRVEGRTLAELLRERTRPSLPVLLRAFLDVSGALAHAHQRGLIHGALGPDQIWLGSFGRVWVTGWERARVASAAPPPVQRAAAEPPPSEPSDRPRAPEVSAGKGVDPRTDVWGLGLVLHHVLCGRPPDRRGRALAAAEAPEELAAIALKALSDAPAERYRRVADLAEDVRRFLDGRRVLAVREGPLAALRRQARRYPLASAIVSAALLLVAGGGALTFAIVRRRTLAARARHDQAEEASRQAQASRDAARAGLDAAEQARLLARKRRELDEALAVPRQDEAGFRAAGRLLEEALASARAGRVGGDAEDLLQLRFLRARAGYWLSRAEHPDPAAALADYRELARRVERALVGERGAAVREAAAAMRGEAQLGRFLAARRLPGRAAQEEEEEALQALAAQPDPDDPAVRFAKNELRLRPLEARALELARAEPPEMLALDEEALALRRDLEALLADRPDLAQAHEQLGRYLHAISCPGLHRSIKVRLAGEPAPVGIRGDFHGAFDHFLQAIQLDPLDPVPRAAFIAVHQTKWGTHSLSRWIGAWSFDQLVRAGRLTPRLEPRLQAVRQLHVLDRYAAALPLALALVEAAEREELPRDGQTLGAARLYLARARLACGLEPGGLPEAEEVPPELEGLRQRLRGWTLLVQGSIGPGLEALLGPGLSGADPLLLADLQLALCDPRIDPRALLPGFSGAIPPPGQQDGHPLVAALLLGRAVAAARAGYDPGPDLARLQRQPWWGNHTTREWLLVELARYGLAARMAPQDPGAHLGLLFAWVSIDEDAASTEDLNRAARDLLVERLQRLGQARAAASFRGFDAVGELWQRRLWVPEEGYRYQVEEPR